MKNYNVKFLLVMICFLINYKAYSRERLQIVTADLEGTWISDDDNSWKMVFTADKCYWYSNNELTDEYNYLISATSPQCGVIVSAGDYYLQLTNSQNGNDKMCYVINGVGDKTLSLSPVDKGGVLVFTKQAKYVRVEVKNTHWEAWPPENYLYGDIYIQLYSDENCTMPLTLSSDLVVNMRLTSNWYDNWGGSGIDLTNYAVTLYAGHASFFIGNFQIQFSNISPGYYEYYDNFDYTIISNGNNYQPCCSTCSAGHVELQIQGICNPIIMRNKYSRFKSALICRFEMRYA